MDEFADYFITAVSYRPFFKSRRIERARVHRVDKDGEPGKGRIWTRTLIEAQINKGRTFITAFQDGQGNWRAGRPVRVIGSLIKFLRSEPNASATDNLGNLPELE